MNATEDIDRSLEQIIERVYQRFHYDFRQYSRSSLRRRIEQAMKLYKCTSVNDLFSKLDLDQTFFPKLLAYLTVNTTEFFRDPSYYRSLRENVLPWLKTFPSVKIWVAGCSTGEEILSLAILFREMHLKRYLIYASDINPMNIEIAKKAMYSAKNVRKASLNYRESGGTGTLSDYYHAAYDSVRFDPSLLEGVVFSDHSIASDNAFSEMHFVSCRNVLIYFNRQLQNRAFTLFYDSLVRGGILGLGSKETIEFSRMKEHFRTLDQNNRIYQKIG